MDYIKNTRDHGLKKTINHILRNGRAFACSHIQTDQKNLVPENPQEQGYAPVGYV
jgi:hypothetical protein